jgi:alpha-galactosidase
MMEVGRLASFEEDRTHFGAWCIVSSPLILGLDVTNTSLLKAMWPIITNTLAINVNQNWFGHPGMKLNTSLSNQFDVWAKPQSAACSAVLVINSMATDPATGVALPFVDVRLQSGVAAPYTVQSIWDHQETPVKATGPSLQVGTLAPHGSGFFLVCGTLK